MAIKATDISARLRYTNGSFKTIATYSNIDPKATANTVASFTQALSSLMMDPIAVQFLIIDTELTEEEEA